MSFCHHFALRCPIDRLPLEQGQGGLHCANQHGFDIARQGYVNLLGAKDKRSRDPGDSQAMIAARRSFLSAGYYQPIAEALGALLLPRLQRESLVVDAGCGEGYYLQRLRKSAVDSGLPLPDMIGFDISKWAVQSAARRFAATWLVASNRNIPLADACADVILDMFGFPDFENFARILKPSGWLVRVGAGEGHLLELRELIYPDIKARRPKMPDPAGFELVSENQLRYATETLYKSAIAELLLMTPHLFRASVQGKERVATMHELTVSVDVRIQIFKRNGN